MPKEKFPVLIPCAKNDCDATHNNLIWHILFPLALLAGIVTHYRLDSPGIGSPWGGGKIFCNHPDQPSAHPASHLMGTGSFPRVMQPGHGIDHSPSSSTEVHETVQLYLCSPSRPSSLFYGRLYHIHKVGPAIWRKIHCLIKIIWNKEEIPINCKMPTV